MSTKEALERSDEFVAGFKKDYRNGWDYTIYTQTPHIYALIERMEKAEAKVKELEKFLSWLEQDEEWDKTWQQVMREWKEQNK